MLAHGTRKGVISPYSSSSQHDDVLGLFQKMHSIVDSVILRKLDPLGEFSSDTKAEEWEILEVRLAF